MGLLNIEDVTHWSIPVNNLEESEEFRRKHPEYVLPSRFVDRRVLRGILRLRAHRATWEFTDDLLQGECAQHTPL